MSQFGESDFRHLISEAEKGNADAARRLLREFGPHVVRAIRRHLPPEMRSEFDSLDFAQAVWGSFFAQPRRLSELEDSEQFIGLLAQMARHKVLHEHRKRFATAKRDKAREERSLGEPIDEQAFASDPTPSQVAVANDLCRALVADQPERYQVILEQRLQGRSHEEIAQLLHMHERSVRRVLDRLGKSLLGENTDGS
jgi:RNA polymerase sigma factor (sigma-70 family)